MMITMDEVFRFPSNPPPVVPISALSTPLPEPLPLPLQLQKQQQVWETRLSHTVQELRQTQERLHRALQRLDDCQQTISQLEGLVGSLKGVVLHLDPIQGAAILNNEIAVMEEIIVLRGGETTTTTTMTERIHTTTTLAHRRGIRSHVLTTERDSVRNEKCSKEHLPLASSDASDVYVFRERLESTTTSDGIPSSSSTATVLLEQKTGGTVPKATISPNKSPQDSMLEDEDEVQRRVQQKLEQQQQQRRQQDSVTVHTSQNSMHENASSSGSSLMWNILEQLTGQTKGILSSSASSLPVLVSTQDNNHNSLERDMETMERELSMTNGRRRTLPTDVLRSSEPLHPRIETISAYPCDQELMIQQALMKKKRRDEEQARSVSSTNIDDRQIMESLSSSNPFVGSTSQTNITSALSQSVPRRNKQDPRIATLSPYPSEQEIMIQQALKRRAEEQRRLRNGDNSTTVAAEHLLETIVGSKNQLLDGNCEKSRSTLGEKRQDPRIMTISHHPSDQEIMIQKALKRKQEEQYRLKESSSSAILLEQKAGGLVPVDAHKNNNDNNCTSSSHPQRAPISQSKMTEESMIEDVVRRQMHQKQRRDVVASDTSRCSINKSHNSGGSRVWGMLLEHLTGQTLGILSASVSSPASAFTRENSNSREREMMTMEGELSAANGTMRIPRADVFPPNHDAPKIMVEPPKKQGLDGGGEHSRMQYSARALGHMRQDPRIMTISHHPSDQEIMIQQALKRREEEQKVSNMVAGNSSTGEMKQDPRIAPRANGQEIIIQEALKHKAAAKTTSRMRISQTSGILTGPTESKQIQFEKRRHLNSNNGSDDSSLDVELKCPDPRIETISIFPADQERFIEAALKKRQSMTDGNTPK